MVLVEERGVELDPDAIADVVVVLVAFKLLWRHAEELHFAPLLFRSARMCFCSI